MKKILPIIILLSSSLLSAATQVTDVCPDARLLEEQGTVQDFLDKLKASCDAQDVSGTVTIFT